MGRRHAGKEEFAMRKPQTSFQLNHDDIQARLPDNSPPSLVMLAFQCTEYDPQSRPLAEDVFGKNLKSYLSFSFSHINNNIIYFL